MRCTTFSARDLSRLLIAASLLVIVACGSDDPAAPEKSKIVLSKESVSFSTEMGQPVAAEQIVVTSSDDQVIENLEVTVGYPLEGASGWLSATVSNEFTPSALTIQPVTTSLGPGTHTATIALSASGVDTRFIPVTLYMSHVSGSPARVARVSYSR